MTREDHIQNLLSIMDGMPSDTCGDWRDSISYAIEQIEKSAWVSCKDELPTEDDTYLVTWRPKNNPFNCNFMWLLSWEGGEWVDDIPQAKYYGAGGYDILAWMPLPNAYVEGAE